MFSYTVVLFFIAFFQRNLGRSLAKRHNVSDGIRLEDTCYNSTQAKLDKIGEQLATLQKIWNAIVLPSFNEKVNLDKAQMSVLTKLIKDKIKELDNKQDEHNDCFPEKWFVPDNFKRIGSRLFYISTRVTLDWFSAGNACRQMGGRLATIQSKEELKLIVSKLKWDSGYWLDLNDLSKEGEFVSASSGKPASFLNWRKGQPDNYKKNEHCVQLTNFYIYDSPCADKKSFICEA